MSFGKLNFVSCAAAAMSLLSTAACAQDSENLAKELSNPLAALVSVPFQYNYDHHLGPNGNGHMSVLNIQPVVPITLNADWNLLVRPIIPLVSQSDVTPGSSDSGLGDIVLSLYFSPKKPTAGGLSWGVGPVFLLPTGTESALSARKWGAGPAGVALKQTGPWTYGGLATHTWGVGGVDSRTNVSNTLIQPFFSYTTKDAWTFSANTESIYNWKSEQWSVPLNFTVSKIVNFGKQPVSIGGTLRYWAESPRGGPRDLGLRLVVTFLFPK